MCIRETCVPGVNTVRTAHHIGIENQVALLLVTYYAIHKSIQMVASRHCSIIEHLALCLVGIGPRSRKSSHDALALKESSHVVPGRIQGNGAVPVLWKTLDGGQCLTPSGRPSHKIGLFRLLAVGSLDDEECHIACFFWCLHGKVAQGLVIEGKIAILRAQRPGLVARVTPEGSIAAPQGVFLIGGPESHVPSHIGNRSVEAAASKCHGFFVPACGQVHLEFYLRRSGIHRAYLAQHLAVCPDGCRPCAAGWLYLCAGDQSPCGGQTDLCCGNHHIIHFQAEHSREGDLHCLKQCGLLGRDNPCADFLLDIVLKLVSQVCVRSGLELFKSRIDLVEQGVSSLWVCEI